MQYFASFFRLPNKKLANDGIGINYGPYTKAQICRLIRCLKLSDDDIRFPDKKKKYIIRIHNYKQGSATESMDDLVWMNKLIKEFTSKDDPYYIIPSLLTSEVSVEELNRCSAIKKSDLCKDATTSIPCEKMMIEVLEFGVPFKKFVQDNATSSKEVKKQFVRKIWSSIVKILKILKSILESDPSITLSNIKIENMVFDTEKNILQLIDVACCSRIIREYGFGITAPEALERMKSSGLSMIVVPPSTRASDWRLYNNRHSICKCCPRDATTSEISIPDISFQVKHIVM